MPGECARLSDLSIHSVRLVRIDVNLWIVNACLTFISESGGSTLNCPDKGLINAIAKIYNDL